MKQVPFLIKSLASPHYQVELRGAVAKTEQQVWETKHFRNIWFHIPGSSADSMQLDQNQKAHTCYTVLSGVFSIEQDFAVQEAQQINSALCTKSTIFFGASMASNWKSGVRWTTRTRRVIQRMRNVSPNQLRALKGILAAVHIWLDRESILQNTKLTPGKASDPYQSHKVQRWVEGCFLPEDNKGWIIKYTKKAVKC